MRLRHEEWMCPLKSRFKVNKKLQFDYAAVFVYSCLWMLLRNNTKSHCSTCGIPLSLSLSHPLLSLLARPWSMRKQGTRGIHGFIVFHHYYWQAQITWMMGNPHTKLTRPCVFTLPKSCCSLAWNRRRRRGGGSRASHPDICRAPVPSCACSQGQSTFKHLSPPILLSSLEKHHDYQPLLGLFPCLHWVYVFHPFRWCHVVDIFY